MKMKKLLCLIISMFVLATVVAKADTGIGFFGGVSTPAGDFEKVYNKDNISITDPEHTLNVLTEAMAKGYHIGGRVKMPVNTNLVLVGGAAWNRFPQNDISIKNLQNEEIARLQVVQDLFPISAGVNLHIIKSFFNVYGIGELTYNYSKVTTNILYKSVAVPLDLEAEMDIVPTSSRVGYAFGAGISFDAYIADITLEGRYNMMNLINKSESEPYKPYFNLSIGISFGGRPKSGSAFIREG